MPLTVVALVSGVIGAESIARNYQIDFGTTWAPTEALREFFVDPVVMPICVISIVLVCVILARIFGPAAR